MDTSTTPMRKTKPTYLKMIAKALLALNESEKKLYHSRYKIAEFMQKMYPVSTSYKRYLRRALKFGVTKKYFLQRKESFRLSALGKQGVLSSKKGRLARLQKATRRPAPPSTTSSTTTTSSVMSQKAARKAARRARRARSQVSRSRVSRSRVSKAKAPVPTTAPTASSKPHKWQYEERPTVFYNYDSKASKLVESAYKEYVAAPSQWDVRSIHSGEWCYQVDFPNMIQTNIQHENHNVRVIRRVPC